MPTATQKKPQQKASPATMPWAKQKYVPRKVATSKDPLLVRLFSIYLVVRASVFLLLAFILSFPQENPISSFLEAHVGLFVRHVPRDVLNGSTTVREFLLILCLLMGVLYAGTAWKWMTRFWLSRWAMMFVAGSTAIKSVLALTAPGEPVSGANAIIASALVDLSPAESGLLMLNIFINAAICLYLMFYPGVEAAFEKSELPGIA